MNHHDPAAADEVAREASQTPRGLPRRLLCSARKPLERGLRTAVIRTLRRSDSVGVDFGQPPGDPGLFGPDSVTWRIHSDFPAMMAGGVCALMLQALHPLALAGVWEHSNFREDLLGRLRRTTAFVAITSFAARADAERMIARVDALHARVRGQLADGRRYSARDSDLLVWVHCTEMWSFLQAYRQYGALEVPISIADRYFDETRRLAEALGAREVPRSVAEVEAYFAAQQAQLDVGARTQAVLAALQQIEIPLPLAGVTRHLFIGAGAVLLPAWAQALLPQSPVMRLRNRTARETLRRLAPALRAALRDGGAAQSCRRVGRGAEQLQRWPACVGRV